MKRVLIACLWGTALASIACADGRGGPTSPSAIAPVSGLAATAPDINGTLAPSASAPRSGALHVTKVCPETTFTGQRGSYCTITSSNVQAIEVDTRIVYLRPDQLGTPSGSDVVLDPPGPDNHKAFGNCSLARGDCTFAGGTGKFTHFTASVAVTHSDDFSLWFWNGAYSFRPQD
jgi:hypothetical protein